MRKAKRFMSRVYWGCAIVVPLFLAGCGSGSGPELVDVTGKVTMDGNPLANATLEFAPAPGTNASVSYGKTDANGEYRLEYSINESGAQPGKYIVRITTFQEADPDEETEAQKETVPSRYNTESELTVDVTADGGPYNFELSTEGAEVVQPKLEDGMGEE